MRMLIAKRPIPLGHEDISLRPERVEVVFRFEGVSNSRHGCALHPRPTKQSIKMLLRNPQCSNLYKSVYYRPSWAIPRERILVTCKMSWNLFVNISFVCPWTAEIAHLPFPTRTFVASGQERVVSRTSVSANLSTDW